MAPNHTLIRVRSHRARDRLKSLLGYLPQGYFSWTKSGEWRECPNGHLSAACEISGITKARDSITELSQYHQW